MDTTNVNSGEKSGMKRLLQHAVWIGCGNYKVTLCFDVLPADATLLALWKFFHYRPLESILLRM